MLRTKEMPHQVLKGFGRCIFCLADDKDLTEEHVIPYSLSGIGEIYIKDGSCGGCNSRINQQYENPLMQNDFKTIRAFLDLKRRKKKKPLKLPSTLSLSRGPIETSIEDTPPLIPLISLPPAGLLTGIDYGDGHAMDIGSVQITIVDLSAKSRKWGDLGANVQIAPGAQPMVMAKIAYAYACTVLGLDRVKGGAAHDLIMERRHDIYNVVGGLAVEEPLTSRHFHHLHLRKRGGWITVIVHLFASFGARPWEVVIGEAYE